MATLDDSIRQAVQAYLARTGMNERKLGAFAAGELRLDRDTICLIQRQVGQVFDSISENILMHLRNTFARGDLDAESTAKEYLVVGPRAGAGSGVP